jgi:Protein ENHANCED DISEASE RESISTANCE 2, C-terminal
MTNGKLTYQNPLMECFKEHRVTAEVFECDHFRIRGGLAVETDYIITVDPIVKSTSTTTFTISNPETEVTFIPFVLSKTYSSFRTLAMELKKCSAKIIYNRKDISTHSPLLQLAQYCDLVYHLVETQQNRTYFGKVNFMYVKVLAKQRKQIINDVLLATCKFYPRQTHDKATTALSDNDNQQYEMAVVQTVMSIIETFFLTDHVCESQGSDSSPSPLDTSHRHVTSPGSEHMTDSRDGSSSGPHHSKKSSSSNPLKLIAKTTSAATGAASKVLTTAAHVTVDGVKVAHSALKRSNSGRLPVSDDEKKLRVGDSQRGSVVVPLSTRNRLSNESRTQEEKELLHIAEDDATLTVENGKNDNSELSKSTELQTSTRLPSYSNPKPTVEFPNAKSKVVQYIESNPMVFGAIMVGCISFIKAASQTQVTVDGDVCLLLIFASFCIGLHTPRPMIGGYDTPSSMKGVVVGRGIGKGSRVDASGRALLRRSIAAVSLPPSNSAVQGSASIGVGGLDVPATVVEMSSLEDDEVVLGSPLPTFPVGAKIGSHNNCISEPDPSDFVVRGPNYLEDRKKFASGEYVFPFRGVDLFLTDSCPENVGSNPSVFGGKLRTKPTFIVNFRLPWGVLILYYEIPSNLVPYLRAREEPDYDKTKIPDMNTLSNPERCVARFLSGTVENRNDTLKIVPVVVDGPWVVKSVVGGKPALIGKKVPIAYTYQPPQKDNDSTKELYLEADLDVAASSAARGILSVARSYTQVLTLNIGFVVEGRAHDELPEQMLSGTRLHGLDPLNALSYPIDPAAIVAAAADGAANDDDSIVF